MTNTRHLKQTFLLEEIDQSMMLDSSQLVREVKKYPIIYDHDLRRDQTAIFMAWEKVCIQIIPNFALMTENHKIAIRKRLRDRWSYMRSTFRRDVLNKNVECHKYLDWIREINFMAVYLLRPPQKNTSMKNSRRRDKYKSSSNKKKTQTKSTSTSTTTSNSSDNNSVHSPIPEASDSSVHSPIPEVGIINIPEYVAINLTESSSSLSDIIISCDSSSSDKSITMLDLSSNTTEVPAEDKSDNDLMVEMFMSTFNSDSDFQSPMDPDQMFLLTMLQSYRLVRDENKESLQHKFYTFLRD